jgi:hypothetical protein
VSARVTMVMMLMQFDQGLPIMHEVLLDSHTGVNQLLMHHIAP